jgi:TP901 family phage tail tape measure protein
MSERGVVVRLRAEVGEYRRAMAEAAKATEGVATAAKTAAEGSAKGAKSNEQHINTLANQAGLLGLAMTAAAATSVNAFADFDQAMSAVAATGDDARGSIEALRDAAVEAGARTAFSATEAAAGVENLAKAGVSAADILAGGLDGSLDLAAAGGLDVAEAAGIASVALTQFGLRGSDVAHVADLLAAGAGKAMGDVTDLGAALRQSGLVASQVGLSIEETTGALAAFASAGLLGSDAGTSLKSMLQRLTPQSAEAQRQFDELGISAYDAQGNFVGLEAFAGQLQDRMRDLTPEARNAALSVMFGSDAVRAASVLYNEGAAGIAEWTAAVDDSGYAAETAATRLDNLRGDVDALGGALESAMIGLGAGANGPLRDLVQGATDVVNAFAELPEPVQNATLALLGGGGLVLLGVAGLGKLAVGVNDAKVAMQALGLSAKTAGLAVAGLGTVLAVGAVGVTTWASAQAEARGRVEELAGTLDELSGALTENSRTWVANALAAEQSFGVFGVGNMQSMLDIAEKYGVSIDTITAAYEGNREAIEKAQAAAREYEAANPWSVVAEAEVLRFNQNLDDQAVRLEKARDLTEGKNRVDEVASGAQRDAADAYAGTTAAIDAQVGSLEQLVKTAMDAAGIVSSEMEAQAAFEAAIDAATAAVAENGATLDLNTAAGRANQAALLDLKDTGYELVASAQANGASQAELQAIMATTRQRFLDAAAAMGMGADQANALADQLGLIPENVNVAVDVATSAAQAAVDRFITVNGARRLTIPIDTVYTSGQAPGAMLRPVEGRAAGGPVRGGFYPSSDSIVTTRLHEQGAPA